jgi:hypothetical protein
MKTLVTIEWSTSQWINRTSFVRRNAPKPTHRGAARMIASFLNERTYRDVTYRPSEITVHRIEQSVYSK